MAKKTRESSPRGLIDLGEHDSGYDPDSPVPPAAWPDFSKPIPTEYSCPACGYQWCGQPKPIAEQYPVAKDITPSEGDRHGD